MPVKQTRIAPTGRPKFTTIDEYHSGFEPGIQALLDKLRKAIHQAAPKAVETISYGIPCFKMNKDLVYYAAYGKHIGFYPTSKPIEVFKDELKSYKTSRGAIQFPLNEALPLGLVKEIVRFRVKEDKVVAGSRKDAKKAKGAKARS